MILFSNLFIANHHSGIFVQPFTTTAVRRAVLTRKRPLRLIPPFSPPEPLSQTTNLYLLNRIALDISRMIRFPALR